MVFLFKKYEWGLWTWRRSWNEESLGWKECLKKGFEGDTYLYNFPEWVCSPTPPWKHIWQMELQAKCCVQNAFDKEIWIFLLIFHNRQWYHNFSYFLVFLNTLLGLVSAFVRIVRGTLLGLFLLSRIDRPVLMRGYEIKDNGKLYVFRAVLE